MKNKSVFNKIIFAGICILFAEMSFAQYDNHVWFFGTGNAGIKFNTETNEPENYNVHESLIREGCAVVVHPETGNFLFYTDGNTIYNTEHEIVENGDGLGSHPSSAQAVTVVPVPGTCGHQYYVFSNSSGGGSIRNIYSTIVDMGMNNGLGAVPENTKKMLVRENVSEGMLIIPSSNSGEYWLIGTDHVSSSSHYVYAVGSVGVQLQETYDFNTGYHSSLSYHSGSNKIAGAAAADSLVYILDFNPLSGALSNFIIIHNDLARNYDSAWSPDGSKVYYSRYYNPLQLYQYDLYEDITTLIYEDLSGIGGGLELGPDEKIYFITRENTSLLSTIDNPNAPAASVDFYLNNYDVGVTILSLKLPETIPARIVNTDSDIVSGVINDYAEILDRCNNSFTINNVEAFNEGDDVVIIQIKGATVDLTNTADFGTILDYGSAGKYEFNRILKIEDNMVVFGNNLLNTYDLNGKLQLVKVPDLGNATVCNLTCKPWNGTTGGVLAFTGGIIEMEGNINVTGMGFKGGIYTDAYSPDCYAGGFTYNVMQADSAGVKGEGVFETSLEYGGGRGHLANGGGAGNTHNNGGGGGGNSGRGGTGGYYVNCFDESQGQGIGLGGQSLEYNPDFPRLFLGGGGGSGHSNNDFGAPGGNGGGIIIARVNKFITNNNSILSNGASIPIHPDYPENHDGGSGGGASGSILLEFDGMQTDSLHISVKGGNGGVVQFTHGHGGGGGGGVLFINEYPSGGINFFASGGLSGKGTDGQTNGATGGEAGDLFILEALPESDISFYDLTITGFNLTPNCDETGDIITQFYGGTPPYSFSMDGINWRTDSTFYNLADDDYTLYIADDCLEHNIEVTVNNSDLLEVHSTEVTDLRCDSLGAFRMQITGGVLPYRYRLDNGNWQSSGTFLYLFHGDYFWEIEDNEGCHLSGSFEIHDLTEELDIVLPVDTALKKGSTMELPVETNALVESSLDYLWMTESELSCFNCKSPIASPEENGHYYVTVTDAFGCVGDAEIFIRVDQNEIYIPNIFSPDGDGINDYFSVWADPVKVNKIKKLEIYNRWGAQIFGTYDVSMNEHFQGWDGTYKGKLMKPQVLIYYVILEMYDGHIIKDTGDVLLIQKY